MSDARYILAFDTANEVIAIGIGHLLPENRSIRVIATREIQARRASNTKLLPNIDEMMRSFSLSRDDLACVCVGRGPGSFTGVRIAMATAKGIASALGIALVGVSSQDAVAYNSWRSGGRGRLLVLGDAMRKEVYPATYELTDEGIKRLDGDTVIKADRFAASGESADMVSGDALFKYADIFTDAGPVRDESEWAPSGSGLLLAAEAQWRCGACDPFDAAAHPPYALLPIYTRLSDAEENERARLADRSKAAAKRDLSSGVQGALNASGDAGESCSLGVEYRPLDAAHLEDVRALEAKLYTSDAWSEAMLADDIARDNRTWWMALCDGVLVGYAGALVVDGDMQVLKVSVTPAMQRRGIAGELMSRIAYDSQNLAAKSASLEVRITNTGAIAFYETLGFHEVGVRPRYYSDGEDALIMSAPLSLLSDKRVAGDRLDIRSHGADTGLHPIILAIESSCDETAAAVTDGDGGLLSDVVASQIDFHARFGGVVPEIASRKHVEAICGVCDIALEQARVSWEDLDAIAVTQHPGLVGALVAGVAFAKGASWALDVPLVGVNHLEGHLYANKIGLDPDRPFEPPAVVSLVSGGNTMLVHMKSWGDYDILGATIDDAVGEAFDKVAKALGLPYPGGPAISALAEKGDPAAIDLPRALMHSKDFRFSLSGLKTAVMVEIERLCKQGGRFPIEDLCASFQQAVIDVQVSKAQTALKQTGAPTFCLGGGVAANPALRRAYEQMCERVGVRLIMPPLNACGDNAAMIALVALDKYAQGDFIGLDADAHAHADL